MKKNVSLLLTLLLLLAALAPAALATDAVDITGVWYLTSLVNGDESLSPAALGLEMSMTLNPDGTALMQTTGQDDQAGTWKEEGGVYLIGDDASMDAFTLVDDTLVAEMEGGKLIFAREPGEALAIPDSPAVSATSVTDFDGVWNGVSMAVMGMHISLAETGVEMQLTIAGGTITALEVAPDEAPKTTEVQGTLEEGKLVATESSDGIDVTMTYTLHEDGTLSMSTAAQGIEAFIYFQRADADEAAQAAQ